MYHFPISKDPVLYGSLMGLEFEAVVVVVSQSERSMKSSEYLKKECKKKWIRRISLYGPMPTMANIHIYIGQFWN